jgi:hypothetical protein
MAELNIKPKTPINKRTRAFQEFEPGLLSLFLLILIINSTNARAMIKRENVRIGTNWIVRK